MAENQCKLFFKTSNKSKDATQMTHLMCLRYAKRSSTSSLSSLPLILSIVQYNIYGIHLKDHKGWVSSHIKRKTLPSFPKVFYHFCIFIIEGITMVIMVESLKIDNAKTGKYVLMISKIFPDP
uniref:Uncharacterized protein n=1 Tax=Glossina austeni TaxID=7395 RepID=A0A1A9V2C7_GLOAU